MVDFKAIYNSQAEAYDRLVSFEDYQHNINAALQSLTPLDDHYIVEFGAGTGRLTKLLAKTSAHIYAFDASLAMLTVAQQQLADHKQSWFAVSDNRTMPLPDASMDIAIAGWSFGHAVGWYPDAWQDHTGQAIAEMQRLLKPNGMAIIFETLGTGSETPQPPTEGLAALYAWLEATHGFTRAVLRTDYQFPDPQTGADALGFFFGNDLAERILNEQLTILPECTGMWSRRY